MFGVIIKSTVILWRLKGRFYDDGDKVKTIQV